MSWRETLNVGKLFIGNKAVEAKTYDVVAVVGAEATNVINVAVQLNDPFEGKPLDEAGVVDFYLADDAAGAVPSTTPPTGGVAAGTNGAIIESVANLSGKLISDVAGQVDIDITDTGTPTFYLVLVLPMGGKKVVGPITFA